MEPLFKFVLERPAVKQDEDLIIDLSQKSDYQIDLGRSIGKKNPRNIVKVASTKFVASKFFIKDIKELKVYDELTKFRNQLSDLESKSKVTPNDINKAVKNAFGEDVKDLILNDKFIASVSNLRDSIIAIKNLPEEQQNPIESLTNALRDLELITQIISDNSFPGNSVVLKRFRKRSLKLPSQSDLRSILAMSEEDRKKLEIAKDEIQKEREDLIKNKVNVYGKLKNTIKEIMNIDLDNLEVTPQKSIKGFTAPEAIQPLSVLKEDILRKSRLGQLQVINVETQIEKGGENIITAEPLIQNVTSNNVNRTFYTGTNQFNPITKLAATFRFRSGTEKLLSKDGLEILKVRNLSIVNNSIDKVVASLKLEMEELSSELESLTETQQTKSMKRIGNTMVTTTVPSVSQWGHLAVLESFSDFGFLSFDSRVPQTKGTVTPSGIADLMIVKQQLKGYRGTDIAHIENIIKGEVKSREHRKFNQTIDDNLLETEINKEEERSLESTDRFELSRETSNTIKQDASLKAGLSVSGSYGPTVSFSVSAEGSLSTSKEEAISTASNFSKDITQRSVETLTERILQTSRTVVTNEVEETNNHTLDNSIGDGHISGVYQWVEKVYEAQMYNYGLRMLFDFMIPEPGAYLVESLQNAHTHSMEIEKPIKFTLQPNQINEGNYNYWIHLYGVSGVNPAPEEYITKTLDYSAGGGDEKTDYYHSGIIQIDEGYRAIQSSIGNLVNIWESSWVTDILIGRRSHRFNSGDSWVWTSNLNDEIDSIPFGLKTNNVSDIAVTVEIKCQRTQRAYKKWQLDTHSKIMSAYKVSLADYEEKLVALEIQAGVEIEGKNPVLNLEIMKDELKKNCITILTEQHFDLFNAVENGANGLPQINVFENKAEGPYVRFFEQAFEWEHITWLTYPYFWGRKNKWEERLAYDDPDPLFNQFIKAGYCRAVIPVRPGFEGAVDHYMIFGEIWEGGPLPAISSELYLPIADELSERLDKPGNEIPEGEPWEVRVPTNLIKLRANDTLPVWEKDSDGNWIEKS